MQKIHTKNSSCSSIGINQLTHSNLFSNNSNKIHLETSLQKNTSHSKQYKKSNNSIEDKHVSPRLEKSTIIKDKNSSFIMDNKKLSTMKSISTSKYTKYHNIKSANVSKSKSKGKTNINKTSHLFSKSNAHLLVKYGGTSSNTKSSNIFSPYESSSGNIKMDFKKISKTAYQSKNNSRKNSAEKKHIINNGVIINGNNLMKSLEMGNRIISGKNKCNYNVNVNINVNNINNNVNNINNINSITSSKASMSSLFKSKPSDSNVFHYKNLSEVPNKNGVSYINNLIKSTQFPHGYKNDVKYIEYITSGLKNNNSTKNTSLSNKSSKKKEEIEKDYLQTKIQLKYNKNSLTTVQSKNNSKSTSRVEEYINTKQSEYKKSTSIKHNVPLTACQSPCGKSAQNIFKKEEPKKGFLKKNFDIFNNMNNISNALKNNVSDINVIDTENEDIEKMLNNTIESVQSTARESMYYRKELEKLANYIKQYHFINSSYPETKIQFYKYGRVIGKGAFGKVNIALHVCSGRLVAIKSFNKKKLKSKHAKAKIKHEIDILKKLRHPFISQ